MIEDLLANELSKQFDTEVKTIYPYKNLWKTDTNKGEFIIKGYKNSNIIRWLSYLGEEVKKKGFTNFPNLIKNDYGNSYIELFNQYYVLIPYIKGRTASYHNETDIKKTVEMMAAFHHSAGFIGNDQSPAPHQMIYNKFEDRLTRFKRLYHELIHRNNKDLLDSQIIYLGKTMINLAEKALENFDVKEMSSLQEDAVSFKLIAHRDVASHNFIITERAWIIDFDLSGFEPQFLDLLQMINRAMLEWKWDVNTFVRIEETYCSFKKLKDNEKKILRQLSLYPNEFFRESLGVYYYPKKYKRESVKKLMNIFTQHIERYYFFQKHILNA